jgi:hypothetical protein
MVTTYKPALSTDGGKSFGHNALVFETKEEAENAAFATFYNWFAATDYRADESTDPVQQMWIKSEARYVDLPVTWIKAEDDQPGLLVRMVFKGNCFGPGFGPDFQTENTGPTAVEFYDTTRMPTIFGDLLFFTHADSVATWEDGKDHDTHMGCLDSDPHKIVIPAARIERIKQFVAYQVEHKAKLDAAAAELSQLK